RAQTPSVPPSESVRVLEALESAFVSVADRVMPAVVNVTVKSKRGPAGADVPGGPEMEERFKEFFGQEFFDRFFRKRSPRDDGRASGSGVIVAHQGFTLPNNPVVENAAEIEVGLSDDRKFKATLVGRDPKTDLAVLRIEAPTGSIPGGARGGVPRARA